MHHTSQSQHTPFTPLSRIRPATGRGTPELDQRFQRLMGDRQWESLPPAVRARFSRRLDEGEARLFAGEVTDTQISAAGLVLAWLGKLIGSPLPDVDGATGPATVSVREDYAQGGQIWTRTYTRQGRFPQTINSVKRFAGVTGLEEYLGAGLTMALSLTVTDGALVFRSTGYGLHLFGRRFALPEWMSPGTCTITHRAHGDHWFSFTLELVHPKLGRLMRQMAVFEEIAV